MDKTPGTFGGQNIDTAKNPSGAALNDFSKAIIQILADELDRGNTSMEKILKNNYFTENTGRAVIVQTPAKTAAFFLRTDIFNNEALKQNEIDNFRSLFSFLDGLKTSGAISIVKNMATAQKYIFYIQDNFLDPEPVNGPITLNAAGDYTKSPEAIFDKLNNVKYRGIAIDKDLYNLVNENAIGIIKANIDLRTLLKPTQKPESIQQPAVTQQQPVLKKPNAKTGLIIAGVALLAFVLWFVVSKMGSTPPPEIAQLTSEKIKIENEKNNIKQKYAKLLATSSSAPNYNQLKTDFYVQRAQIDNDISHFATDIATFDKEAGSKYKDFIASIRSSLASDYNDVNIYKTYNK